MSYSPQKRITERGRLLDSKGRLTAWGWSPQPLLDYDRSDIPFIYRLNAKEWDSYIFGDSQWQICISIADNSYLGIASASVMNLREGWHKTDICTEPITMGRYEMPNNSGFGDIVYRSKNASINISLGQNERRLTVRYPNFDDVKELYVTAIFHDLKDEALSAVIPFKNKNQFLYTHKMHCMPVDALMRYGGLETRFDSSNTPGSYQWCRCVLPQKAHWFCCSANGFHEGNRFGFNLGKGLGDRRECGENAFFYKGRVYKIGELDITVPNDRARESWTLIGEDGDINLRMVPLCAAENKTRALGFVSLEHDRFFGKYYGTVMLRSEDGNIERLVLDGVSGFAEEVGGRW